MLKVSWILKFAAALLLLAGLTATASARDVKCRIISDGQTKVDGTCNFVSEEGGSFSLSAAGGGGMLYDGIEVVSVSIITPGQAEVRGLTSDGINSRWGVAERSNQDRACWVGDGFSICAW